MQKYFHAEIESHSHSTMGGSHCEPEEFARNTRRQSGLIGEALARQAKDASLLEYLLPVQYFYSPLSRGCLVARTSDLTWDGRNQDHTSATLEASQGSVAISPPTDFSLLFQ